MTIIILLPAQCHDYRLSTLLVDFRNLWTRLRRRAAPRTADSVRKHVDDADDQSLILTDDARPNID